MGRGGEKREVDPQSLLYGRPRPRRRLLADGEKTELVTIFTSSGYNQLDLQLDGDGQEQALLLAGEGKEYFFFSDGNSFQQSPLPEKNLRRGEIIIGGDRQRYLLLQEDGQPAHIYFSHPNLGHGERQWEQVPASWQHGKHFSLSTALPNEDGFLIGTANRNGDNIFLLSAQFTKQRHSMQTDLEFKREEGADHPVELAVLPDGSLIWAHQDEQQLWQLRWACGQSDDPRSLLYHGRAAPGAIRVASLDGTPAATFLLPNGEAYYTDSFCSEPLSLGLSANIPSLAASEDGRAIVAWSDGKEERVQSLLLAPGGKVVEKRHDLSDRGAGDLKIIAGHLAWLQTEHDQQEGIALLPPGDSEPHYLPLGSKEGRIASWDLLFDEQQRWHCLWTTFNEEKGRLKLLRARQSDG